MSRQKIVGITWNTIPSIFTPFLVPYYILFSTYLRFIQIVLSNEKDGISFIDF